MACQKSMTHSEEERKDGVPKKYDPKNGERISQEEELSSTLCTGLISK